MKQKFVDIINKLSTAEKIAVCVFAALHIAATVLCAVSTRKPLLTAIYFFAVLAAFAVFTALNIVRRKASASIGKAALAVAVALTVLVPAVFVCIFDFDMNIVNLYQKPLVVTDAEDIVFALENGYVNIVMETDPEVFFKTGFTYSQYIKEVITADDGSKDTHITETVNLYDYYIFQYDNRFFMMRYPYEKFDNYFETYKDEALKPITVTAIKKPDMEVLKELKLEFYSYIYPEDFFDGEETDDGDYEIKEDYADTDDESLLEQYESQYNSNRIEKYNKVYGDLPEGELVDTLCLVASDGNINFKRTQLPFLLTVFPFGIVSLFVGVKKKEEASEEKKKRYVPKLVKQHIKKLKKR